MLEIKCCVCTESRVLDVHHVDEDRANNDVTNLVFLCPNHHAIYHRFGAQEVIDAIITELDTRACSSMDYSTWLRTKRLGIRVPPDPPINTYHAKI